FKMAEKEVEIFSKEVTDFSSQYGTEKSITYAATNLAGPSSIYPNYGDFTQAFVLRTYGPWWTQCPSTSKPFKKTPENWHSRDFVELHFEKKCYINSITIYETYNPGAVVRILASDDTKPSQPRWYVLWEGEQQTCRAEPRAFQPTIRPCNFKTNLLRLEFCSTHLMYYTELDAVSITTKDSVNKLKANKDGSSVDASAIDRINQNLKEIRLDTEDGEKCNFDILPDEIIHVILSQLDLVSLSNVAQTCRRLWKLSYDPLLYTELNLQPHWCQVSDTALQGLSTRCGYIQRLSLSWCGPHHSSRKSNPPFTEEGCTRFIQGCSEQLSSLHLSSCNFLTGNSLEDIVNNCRNLSELDLSSCGNIDNFAALSNTTTLRRLNLYRTNITTDPLTALIRSNQGLEHLNLGSCVCVTDYHQVAVALADNCKQLKSVDFWRSKTLGNDGLIALANNCPLLEELDLGWCNNLRSTSGCFVQVAKNCPNLRKIFLTANRSVCDDDLQALAKYSSNLEQLDILGTREVTVEMAILVLESCKKLTFFDVSFCAGLDFLAVQNLQRNYPRVSIKKSFQN
ncbi:unnamed protein product, partial [Owenia fusiformis]